MEEVDRVLKAKIQLQKDKPFFGYILLRIRHYEDSKTPTMKINYHGEIFYNPDWVKTLNDDELKGVLEHEALHPIFEHLKRKIAYLCKNKRLADKVWRISEDLVVNDILVSNKQTLPTCGIIPTVNHSYTFMDYDITVEDIDKKTVEIIYEEIMKQLPKSDRDKEGQDGQQGESKKGDQKGNQNSEGGDQDEQDEESEDGDEEDEDQSKDDGEGNEPDIIEILPNGWDEHERDDKASEEDQEEELKKWRQVYMGAVAHARDRGDLPLGVERRCDELFKEKVNWRGILQRFVSQMIPYDYTWLTPSRKSPALGVYIPSTASEKIEVVISIDTSGSISDETLSEFVSEMCGIARQFHSVDMVIIVCDCEIHDEPLDLKNTSPEEIMRYLKLKGKGGTSHLPVFNFIKNKKPHTALLIAFTDGQTEFPKSDSVRIKTLWVLGGDHIDEDEVPFGTAITIPQYG